MKNKTGRKNDANHIILDNESIALDYVRNVFD